VLRIIVMPITGQHDVMFMPWMTHFINQGHFNLYAFLHERFGDIVMRRPAVWAPYPYGFYALTASWLEFLGKLRLLDLATWDSVWRVPHPARLVFLFKAAYLPFDLAIGYILYRVCGRIGLALWAWSPAAIYTPFMMGQNDIYATAFTVAGVYAAAKSIQITSQEQCTTPLSLNKWAVLSSVFLGIGATFKIYPLLLLPPLALVVGRKWEQRLLLLCLGCSMFGITTLPFVATPTYVNGVLLNPEGTRIFRTIQLFGTSVSPFLIGYLLLFSVLIIRDNQPSSPYIAWFISLIVMVLMFLWVPTPFYWLIWITPLLIGVVDKTPKLVFPWFGLQLAFALTLLTQHRELGVALPIHLSSKFNVPNLPTALALTHPFLSRIFVTAWPIVDACFVTALLLVLWHGFNALTKRANFFTTYGRKVLLGIGIPTTVMLLGLMVNLCFSRNLVSHNNWYNWHNQTLSAGDSVVQEINLESPGITGIRLRFADASPSATLRICLYRNGDLTQEPLRCTSRRATEQVENQALYFIFDTPLFLRSGEMLVARIQVEGSDATVTLPYAATTTGEHLQFVDSALNGSLDISVLSFFSITEALKHLVVENVFQDGWLLLSIGITVVLTLLFLCVLFIADPFLSTP